MNIDTTFNMQTDARGLDPDSHSPTLKDIISCFGVRHFQMERFMN